MRRGTKFGAVALVVAAAGVAAWWSWHGTDRGAPRVDDTRPRAGATDAGDAKGANAPPSSATPNPAIAEGRAEPQREAATPNLPVDPAATWIVEGLTTRGWRDPYPNVHVKLRLFDGYEAVGTPRLETRVETDASGRFRWALRPPTATLTIDAVGDEPNRTSLRESALVVVGRPPPKFEIRLLPKDFTVHGVVRGAAGKPIAGAKVGVAREYATTGDDGRYELLSSAERGEIMVTASADHYAQMRSVVESPTPGGNATVDFDLVASFRVKGRVVDESTQPIEGATIQSFFTGDDSTTSGVDGRFLIDHLDSNRASHLVYARKPGYVQATTDAKVEGASGGELEVGDLVLKRGVRVEGNVVDESNHPLAGVKLYIGFSPSSYDRLDATSHDDGTFVFPNVPTGSQTMVASRDDFAPDRRVLTLKPDELVVQVVVRLAHGHFAAGVVHDDAGAAVAAMRVHARHAGEYIDTSTTTDADGRFRLENLPASDVALELYAKGFVRKSVPLERVDVDDLAVVVERAGRLAGRVVDGLTSQPLEDFAIRLVQPDVFDPKHRVFGYSATWAREGHQFHGTHGVWDSGEETLPPDGVIGVEVRAEGYAPAHLGHVVVSRKPDPDACVARLFTGATVRGRVVDADGTAVPTTRVAVKRAEDSSRRFSEEPYEAGTTRSGDDGSFELKAVAPGSVVLLVKVAEQPLVVDGPFDVPASGEVERRVQLPRGFALVGEVESADGTPLAGASVSIFLSSESRGDEPYSSSTKSDAAGCFQFSGLPEGLYQVSHAVQDGMVSCFVFTCFVRVAAGSENKVVLRPTGSSVIVGTITTKDGSAVPSPISVTAWPKSDASTPREAAPPQLGAIAHDGRFRIEGVQPGSYRISADVWSETQYTSGGAQVEVGSGETSVTIELVTAPLRRQ